jgi:HAD superfamily hydrolase (TIGR01509 family)
MKTILVDALNTFVIEGQGVFKDMYDLLETYPNRKIVVTNANDEQCVQFGFTDLPYEMFSLKHSPDKPDPVYFETLLTQYNFSADEVVYFEHNPAAVESARSVGIAVYQYDHNIQDLVALKTFLDLELKE